MIGTYNFNHLRMMFLNDFLGILKRRRNIGRESDHMKEMGLQKRMVKIKVATVLISELESFSKQVKRIHRSGRYDLLAQTYISY